MARVLVVDDEPDVLVAVRSALEARGHEVVLAADGRMALSRVASEQPDAVLLDLHMPVLDGYGVLAELASSGDGRPVLVLVATSNAVEDARRALAAGAVATALKPDHGGGADVVVEAIERCLAADPAERARARTETLRRLQP